MSQESGFADGQADEGRGDVEAVGERVEQLAETNVGAFCQKEVQYIITACASCNGGIGEYYRTMKANYDDFTGKVVDFSVFLKKEGLFEELAGMKKLGQLSLRDTAIDGTGLKHLAGAAASITITQSAAGKLFIFSSVPAPPRLGPRGREFVMDGSLPAGRMACKLISPATGFSRRRSD